MDVEGKNVPDGGSGKCKGPGKSMPVVYEADCETGVASVGM